MKLEDSGILVTGASRGLGRAIAVACAREGADVAITGRDEKTLDETAALVRAARVDEAQRVLTLVGDVRLPDDTERHAREAFSGLRRFTGLVNNAGVYGPMGRLPDNDWDAWRECIEINLFGVALMCRAVLPLFERVGGGAILNLSGGGATAPLPAISGYAAAKAAVVRLTETLALEYRDSGISINALAPGALNTTMLDQALAAGPAVLGEQFYAKAIAQAEGGGTPLDRGADLAVWAMSTASRNITGRLLSAVWDPWETLQLKAEDIAGSDIYTLRRIVPADRGFSWGDR